MDPKFELRIRCEEHVFHAVYAGEDELQHAVLALTAIASAREFKKALGKAIAEVKKENSFRGN